jgi:hypothetical protein
MSKKRDEMAAASPIPSVKGERNIRDGGYVP